MTILNSKLTESLDEAIIEESELMRDASPDFDACPDSEGSGF